MATELIFIGLRTALFDDTQIKYIESLPDADALLVIWIKLLCLAGKCNRDGEIIIAPNVPVTDAALVQIFGRPLNTIRAALAVFQNLGMIELFEGRGLRICDWEKHHAVAGIQRAREQNRIRQQKRRAKQKLLPTSAGNVDANTGKHDPFAGCTPEVVEKWRPTYEALAATGKLPALTVEHLNLVDREHKGARLAENVAEIAAEARGVAGQVGATLPWLRCAVSRLARRIETRETQVSNEDKF